MQHDAAFEVFSNLRVEWKANLEKIKTEQDTRFNVINRMLTDVLGWSHSDIPTEVHVDGGYVDYLLKSGPRNLLVLEAKKKSFELLNSANKRTFDCSLNSKILELAQDGIEQARRYCFNSHVSPAVLTNGFQWIFFRGIRIDGLGIEEQKAIVFPNLDAIAEDFVMFYEMMSLEGLSKEFFEIHLSRYEENSPQSSEQFTPAISDGRVHLLTRSALSIDLEPVIKKFFTDMSSSDDPEMLRECFVESSESRDADSEISKIMERIYSNMTAVKKDQLAQLTKQMVQLIKDDPAQKTSEVILIVGKTGAGKTTFIDRFFQQALASKLREECVVIRIDMAKFDEGSTTSDRLTRDIIKGIETELFEDGLPSGKDIKAIFNREFHRKKKNEWSMDNDRAQNKKFLEYMEKYSATQPFDYMIGLLQHGAIANRQKLPCLIFDNADIFSIETQQKIFQYAQSIKQQLSHVLLICPITPDSLMGLNNTSIFESYFTKKFFLPVPLMKEILARRIRYIQKKISEAKSIAATNNTQKSKNYFLRNGFNISIKDLTAFASLLEDNFINQEFVTRLIGKLANFKIRDSLKLLGEIITSPHIDVDSLILGYIKKSAVGVDHDIKDKHVIRAALACKYEYHLEKQNDFIKNVFSFDASIITSPLMKLRVLQFLSEKYHSAGSHEHRGYVDVKDVQTFFKPLGVRPTTITTLIRDLYYGGLVSRFDQSKPKHADINRICISDRGLQHLELGLRNLMYITQMGVRTRMRECDELSKIKTALSKSGYQKWTEILQLFVSYCLHEDRLYLGEIPEIDQYISQRNLTVAFASIDHGTGSLSAA